MSFNYRWLAVILGAGAMLRGASLAAGAMPDPGPLPAAATNVGLTEHLGETLPLDLAFYDQTETRHTLGELLTRPTILALIFYHCPGACGMIQSSVARAIKEVPGELGKDYQVLSISFDDEETPDLAREAMGNYTHLVGKDVPPGAWRFMTGDAENVRRLCDAVGFRVAKLGRHDYIHPNLVTVVAPGGKIIRYLYGLEYLPLDVGMALSEAARGTPGLSIRKIVSYCYGYDPKNRRYAFQLFRVFGVTTLVVVGTFVFFLLRKGRGQPAGGNPS